MSVNSGVASHFDFPSLVPDLLPGVKWLLLTFLERSGTVPRHIPYSGPRILTVDEESPSVLTVSPVTFFVGSPSPAMRLWKRRYNATYEFPCLRPLDLSITTPSPSFQTAPTLMKRDTFGRLEKGLMRITPKIFHPRVASSVFG